MDAFEPVATAVVTVNVMIVFGLPVFGLALIETVGSGRLTTTTAVVACDESPLVSVAVAVIVYVPGAKKTCASVAVFDPTVVCCPSPQLTTIDRIGLCDAPGAVTVKVTVAAWPAIAGFGVTAPN